MQVWNVLHAAHWKCRTQKNHQKFAIWAPSHNFVGYIFATKARIDNRRKNLSNSNVSLTCPPSMVSFGPLAAVICWWVWGTPANFNGFRLLAALLHGTLYWASAKLCSIEQRTPPIFCRRPSRWAFAHLASFFFFSSSILSSRRLHVYHTFTHYVALVRI